MVPRGRCRRIYWTEVDTTGASTLRSVHKDGTGDPVVWSLPALVNGYGIVVDDTAVYFMESYPLGAGPARRGSVLKVVKPVS